MLMSRFYINITMTLNQADPGKVVPFIQERVTKFGNRFDAIKFPRITSFSIREQSLFEDSLDHYKLIKFTLR